MQTQLIEMQTQIAFQEQTIAELNDALTSQQQQLDKLLLLVEGLRDKIEQEKDQGSDGLAHELPPHY